jgi:hypothetical protein
MQYAYRSDTSKDAGLTPELFILDAIVPAHTKAVAVDGSPSVQAKPRVKGLVDDRMTWSCEQLPANQSGISLTITVG